MQFTTILSDCQCESLAGGYGKWGYLTKISTKNLAYVNNDVYQKNTAYNSGGGGSSWGWGKYKGYGMASSIANVQANSADLVSVVL